MADGKPRQKSLAILPFAVAEPRNESRHSARSLLAGSNTELEEGIVYIYRRLFVVPLADNDHGKSTIIRSMVSQAIGRKIGLHRKAARDMVTPWGRHVDAYVFGRSYQEVERGIYGSVVAALDGNDPDWKQRELIVMPSHVAAKDIADIKDMIGAAHAAGFDAIAAPVVYEDEHSNNRANLAPALALQWDARWTIPNPWQKDPRGQLWALGNDLWSWISQALTR